MPHSASSVSGSVATNDLVPSLLEITESKVWPQIQDEHFMWKRFFQKRGKAVNSRKRQIVLHLRPGQVGSFRPEGGSLPRSKSDLQVKASIAYTKYQRGFSFTPEAMEEQMGSNSLMSLEDRLDIYREAIKTELAAFFYGTGSGAVAVVDDAPTDNADGTFTITVKKTTDEFGGVGSRGTADLVIGSEYEFIDSSASDAVIAASTGATRFEVLEDDISATTFKISLAAASTLDIVDGDIIVPPGTYVSGVSHAFYGLGYHITTASTDEWQGLDPSATPELRSITKNANTANLTLGLANFIEEAVRFRRVSSAKGGEDKSLIVAPIGQEVRLLQYLQSYRRATMDETVLKTSGQAVENKWGNRWETDAQCPDTRIFHLKEDCFSMLVPGKGLSFVRTGQEDNMILRQDASDDDLYAHIYDGWFSMMFEFASNRPMEQAMVYNLGVSGILTAADYRRSY